MNLGRFKDSILYKIFERIDKNNDGWITYKEYMDWAKRFLAMVCLDSSEFLAS
jgi:Ca2+-binding EF-hand superfamily protein